MSAQQQAKRPAAKSAHAETLADAPQGDEQALSVSSATDDLLDEIDAVLESNAAEFVDAYRQENGQ